MLEKQYNSKIIEQDKYKFWLENNLFKSGDITKTPFCVVIPPPNITGKLHLGHAWDTSMQDLICRYKRMKGYDVLWLPGMDHAGIATQAKVDEKLKKMGINPRSLSREDWLKYAWDWKDEFASIIRVQWAKLGLSLDYSKERFTLDEGLSNAVKKAFIELYNKGLIYRGERIINFDPEAMTALSNIEVIYKDIEGALYHLKYMLEGSNDYLEVVTTRPETIFGDTALAVNPKDKRYTSYIGKNVIIPIINKKIPVIADIYADMNFGSGIVKITPAHDPNDFEVGNRHNLERIVCMNKNATMNSNAFQYEGLDRFECRKQLLKDLEEKGLLIRTEKIIHSVGHSERTDVMVEPYLSEQWFVKMDVLAKQSLDNQKDKNNRVNFIPKRFEKIFTNWMENIQDWCISRQLNWGHRIPAWYKGEEIYVGYEAPTGEGWIQDPDVLDTWFSSALWPFSTLGWPGETERYFPTDVLVTAYDLIFFWVSRMIFQSLEFTHQRPFKEVLIHGLIRDKNGVKMSKSLGNGVDPMDVIEQYGTDALRFFLNTSTAPGQDLRYDEEKTKASWNFVNKLWNASRFVLMNIEGIKKEDLNFNNLNSYDKWILTKMNITIKQVTKAMDKYEFNIVGSTLYSFIWNDFCDWYIELAKVNMNEANTKGVLYTVLVNILKMLHPFMPYVTEEIYQTLPLKDKISIMIEDYPTIDDEFNFNNTLDEIANIISIIQKIRTIRLENNLNDYLLVGDLDNKLLNDNKIIIGKLLKLKSEIIDIKDFNKGNMSTLTVTLPTMELIVAFNKNISIEDEIAKLNEEKQMLMASIERRNKLLSNENYVKKAPESIVSDEKKKKEEEEERLKIVETKLQQLH
jgi:valyl-tRNA synthetase